jgi:DNA polymerase-3 subunit alpha (Gram-positive type)
MEAGLQHPVRDLPRLQGNKEPDIDLNFSGEYQTKAHAYTKVIFGAESDLQGRAPSARGGQDGVRICEELLRGQRHSQASCEIDGSRRGASGSAGPPASTRAASSSCRRAEDINTFTPVQHPADDPDSDIVSTHFDYHSIDHNLLKLDILGHDDPTMIRMLQDLTGIDPRRSAGRAEGHEPVQNRQRSASRRSRFTAASGRHAGNSGVRHEASSCSMLEDTKPQNVTELSRFRAFLTAPTCGLATRRR